MQYNITWYMKTKETVLEELTTIWVAKIKKQSPNLKPIQVRLLAEVAAEAIYETKFSLRIQFTYNKAPVYLW